MRFYRELKLCSWNIAGLRGKLEKKVIFDFIQGFDVVWLLESKEYFHVSVPGFMVYCNISAKRYGQRRSGDAR